MSNIFLISDTHFSHEGVTKFLNKDGTKLRPFDTVEQMDEYMVEKWNEVVTSKDKVYHLGDVTMKHQHLNILSRLNGKKVLIKGNHDIFKLSQYSKYFYDVRGYHVLDGIIMSHIPIHSDSIERFRANIHGHLHSNRVMKDGLIDNRYFNVSVEQISYQPIPFEVVNGFLKRVLS